MKIKFFDSSKLNRVSSQLTAEKQFFLIHSNAESDPVEEYKDWTSFAHTDGVKAWSSGSFFF